MSPERLLLGVACVIPLLAVPELSSRAADALGTHLGRQLAAVGTPRQAPSPVPLETLLPEASALSSADVPAAPSAKQRPKRRRAAAEPPAVTTIHVSADSVLALAERGVIPSAAPVPAEAGRPAGLLLRGVSGLGVGLRDGDVLVAVEGQPVSSLEQVVGLVVARRSRRAPVITGRVFRGDRGLALSVEQPYAWKKAAPLLADSRLRG